MAVAASDLLPSDMKIQVPSPASYLLAKPFVYEKRRRSIADVDHGALVVHAVMRRFLAAVGVSA